MDREYQNFWVDKEFGEEGELFVQQLLLDNKWIKTTKIEGKCDYDLVTDTGITIEVKFDRYENTGNVCLELWSDKPYRVKGWLQKNNIDILAYIFASREGIPKEVVLYNMKAIRQILFDYCFDGDWEAHHGLHIADAKFNGNTDVENLLIPREWLSLTKPITLYKT